VGEMWCWGEGEGGRGRGSEGREGGEGGRRGGGRGAGRGGRGARAGGGACVRGRAGWTAPYCLTPTPKCVGGGGVARSSKYSRGVRRSFFRRPLLPAAPLLAPRHSHPPLPIAHCPLLSLRHCHFAHSHSRFAIHADCHVPIPSLISIPIAAAAESPSWAQLAAGRLAAAGAGGWWLVVRQSVAGNK
jgi:hypothetical protein